MSPPRPSSRVAGWRKGKAHAHHERDREYQRVHQSVAEWQHTRQAAASEARDEPRECERDERDTRRGDGRSNTDAPHAPNKQRAPRKDDRDVQYQSRKDQSDRTRTRRPMKDHRADRRERDGRAAESMADRDERSRRRRCGDAADDDVDDEVDDDAR